MGVWWDGQTRMASAPYYAYGGKVLQQALERDRDILSVYFQQEQPQMSTKTEGTLDGMSVEQLRELAQRAEATAKQKEADADAKAKAEEEAQYVHLGRIAMWEFRVRKSNGDVEYKHLTNGRWLLEKEYTRKIGHIIVENEGRNLKNLGEILTVAGKIKEQRGGWK